MTDSLAVGRDPYLDYALKAQSTPTTPRYTYVAAQDATYTAPVVQTGTTYSAPSDTGNGLVTGLCIGGTVVGAAALIYEGYKHGDGKGIWAGIKKMCGVAGEAITGKPTRAMKEFTLFTKEGHKIIVKDNGKVSKIFKSETTSNPSTIDRYLREEGFSLGTDKLWCDGTKLKKGVTLNEYTIPHDGTDFVVNENGEIIKAIRGHNYYTRDARNPHYDLDNYLDHFAGLDKLEERIAKIKDGSSNSLDRIKNVSFRYEGRDGSVYEQFLERGRFKEQLTRTCETPLTETERKAFLGENPDINAQIKKLAEEGRADNIKVQRTQLKDDSGNEYIIENGEVTEIIEKNKFGRRKATHKKGSTGFWAFKHDHQSFFETIQKEIESGLGTDGTVFRYTN